jgi:Arc/MetJ family transcription regulator
MGKHLVDIDEEALRAARARLGSETIKETVNRALRQAGDQQGEAVKRRLDCSLKPSWILASKAWR